jgi:hypothetical protein
MKFIRQVRPSSFVFYPSTYPEIVFGSSSGF